MNERMKQRLRRLASFASPFFGAFLWVTSFDAVHQGYEWWSLTLFLCGTFALLLCPVLALLSESEWRERR